MKYAPSFQAYLKRFNLAQEWALSEEGSAWIKKNIPSLSELINSRYDECNFSVYVIRLNNNIPLYVGESIRAVRRLCVHAYNLNTQPELFGLNATDEFNISMELLKEGLYDEDMRKLEEKYYIEKLKPLLQTTKESDICLPRRDRKKAVEAALHIV